MLTGFTEEWLASSHEQGSYYHENNLVRSASEKFLGFLNERRIAENKLTEVVFEWIKDIKNTLYLIDIPLWHTAGEGMPLPKRISVRPMTARSTKTDFARSFSRGHLT